MDDHIWSCCELTVGGQSSLTVDDVFSNLIHSLCEAIHAVRVPSGLLEWAAVCVVAMTTVLCVVKCNSCSHMT